MKLVKKIYFRNSETYNRLYQGAELLFEVKREFDYLTFTALEKSTIQYIPSSVTTARYSYDKVNWVKADNVTLNLNTDDKVYFKGTITGNQSDSNYANFTMTGKISASGSIMSMHNGNQDYKTLKYDYEFYKLFNGCTSLVTAPDLPATTLTDDCYDFMFADCKSLTTAPAILPATTLTYCCYQHMFGGCSNLTTVPELPATTLSERCYASMFEDCTSLTSAPELPATKLAYECYRYMFSGCHSLTTAPELPATTLANYCYGDMFLNCHSLTTAPELPATTLVDNCYTGMFLYCNNLNYIKAMFTTTPSDAYTSNWVDGVASTGTFVKNKDATWNVIGVNGVPTGWTVEPKQYDVLYVSGRYNFKIPKGDGTYYVIDTKNDCEVDIISDNNKSSITGKIFTSNSQGDKYEWDLFFTGTKLYFDLSFKNNRRLSWTFGTLNANTKYTIGGSNGNYLGTDRALYFNGSKKASSTTKSTYNNTSDIAFIGENVTDFYVGNIKIYESTGLVYHIVPIMYNGNVAFYDKVNKRFIEITATPPSEYAKTRLTGEKVII